MKKNLLLLLALFTITNTSQAQDDQGYKGHFGISLGPSIPLGDLKSKDIDNNDAGFANGGAMFDISFNYNLGTSKFGVAALLRSQYNPLDDLSYAIEFANAFPGDDITVYSDGWGISGLMLGGFGSFPISNKISFAPRAMLGFMGASAPDIILIEKNKFGSIWSKQSSESAIALTFLIGAGFNFDIGKRLCLLTNLDYLGSNPEFSNVEYLSSNGDRTYDTWSQKMGTLNLGAGIAYKFK